MLKYALLGFLSYLPMTGYEIKQRMDRSTAHFWYANLSQIYTTLNRLEGEGLLESTVQEQADRPDRRVYTITPSGRRSFLDWLAQPCLELSPKKETLVLKMFFAAQLEPADVLTQLRVQLDLHQRQLAYYQQDTAANIQAARDEFPTLERDARFWEATRRYGELIEAVSVSWLQEMIELVQNEPSGPPNPQD